LGKQDYSTATWTKVTTDLSAEDYSDNSRWVKQTTITAVAVAASVGVGAGGVGIGISGAGAEATNLISTKTNAYIEDSSLKTTGAGTGPGTGDVTLDAQSDASINAVIVGASAAIGAGALGGLGASIGVALARNYVGYGLDPTVSATYSTASLPDKLLLSPGNTVRIVEGVRAGDVYQYLGTAFSVKYNSKDGSKSVNKNDLVQLALNYTGGGSAGGIYQWTGGTSTLNLGTQNYGSGSWTFCRLGTACRSGLRQQQTLEARQPHQYERSLARRSAGLREEFEHRRRGQSYADCD